jgi:hypothetical protein
MNSRPVWDLVSKTEKGRKHRHTLYMDEPTLLAHTGSVVTPQHSPAKVSWKQPQINTHISIADSNKTLLAETKGQYIWLWAVAQQLLSEGLVTVDCCFLGLWSSMLACMSSQAVHKLFLWGCLHWKAVQVLHLIYQSYSNIWNFFSIYTNIPFPKFSQEPSLLYHKVPH